jgi:hypothetical protein
MIFLIDFFFSYFSILYSFPTISSICFYFVVAGTFIIAGLFSSEKGTARVKSTKLRDVSD